MTHSRRLTLAVPRVCAEFTADSNYERLAVNAKRPLKSGPDGPHGRASAVFYQHILARRAKAITDRKHDCMGAPPKVSSTRGRPRLASSIRPKGSERLLSRAAFIAGTLLWEQIPPQSSAAVGIEMKRHKRALGQYTPD